MRQFILRYFLFLAILFTLFYEETSIVSRVLNDAQTNLTLLFVSFFLEPWQLQGIDIWINPHYKIIINQACNGMIPILFLFASILVYSAGIWHKVFWMLLGYLFLSMVNVGRILLVVYVTKESGRAQFYWSHDLVGNVLLLFAGLGLFIAFIQTSSKRGKSIVS